MSHQKPQKAKVSKDNKLHLLLLSYACPKGGKLIRSMNNVHKSNLPDNTVTKSVDSAIRWINKFNIKTIIKKDHQHDVTYDFECTEENCNKK